MADGVEVNFDGLVGPTHNYGGLSYGNLASITHRALSSNPRDAALQGIAKMRFLSSLGLRQGVLPPQPRPDLGTLRRLGFSGTDAEVLGLAATHAPELLANVSSASSMWSANAATVSPSADSADGKVHFTPANLISKFHRSLEPAQTARTLRAIFRDPAVFVHHDELPPGPAFGDEGAANHTRFCPDYGSPGLQLFVFGRHCFRAAEGEPREFPARQSSEASHAIARLHRLDPSRVLFIQQNPAAIDAGVFHNDVASVGNLDFFLCHEEAFLESQRVLDGLQSAYRRLGRGELRGVLVPSGEVSLRDAVQSYLFNSQIVSPPKEPGTMALIAPLECEENPRVRDYLDRLLQSGDTPIRKLHVFDLRQSMRNGGGPACLRLRVVLTASELDRVHADVLLTDALGQKLESWVKKHYRDRLLPEDLGDPSLAEESRVALDELTGILKLGSIYPFQRGQG